MRALAILCARNEEMHIRSSLSDLIAEGLEVILIDHDSTDRTAEIARDFLGRGLLGIERLSWNGLFSLSEQLAAKQQIIDRIDHDWIVHVDADEWLMGPYAGQTLLAGFEQAEQAGYNCVHFNEFVFVPRPGEDLYVEDYRRLSTRYYFYQPCYPFLIRAWRNKDGLENSEHAGHILSGDQRLSPVDFHMRHYIFLSEAHARRKYIGRRFSQSEVAKGWHCDRILATEENLLFPEDARMHSLAHWTSRALETSNPLKRHFWEWNLDNPVVGSGDED